MIDSDERLARSPCHPFRYLHADEQRPHESRPIRDRDGADLIPGDRCAGHRLAHHVSHVPHVIARRELGDDAPVLGVEANLALDDVAHDPPVVVDDRRARLVAGRLDP